MVRRPNARRIGVLLLIVTMPVALAACAGSSRSNSEQIIYGADQFPDNLNPNISAGNTTATTNADIGVLPSAFITLPNFEPQYSHELLRAEPKVTGQSPFTVEYMINPKATWSDGTPIDAKDFIFAWKSNNPNDADYSADGALGSKACQTIGTYPYQVIKAVTGSNDNRTVTATFATPSPDWKQFFHLLLPAHLFVKSSPAATCAAFNTGWPSTSKPPVSGGPWSIAAINATDKTITEVHNERYWAAKPKLSKLIFKVVSSGGQALQQALENNEIDVTYPQPQLDLVNLLKTTPNITSETEFGLHLEHIDFNLENPYLADPVLRRAIAMSIDRNDLVRRTVGQFNSNATVAGNHVFVNNQPGYVNSAPADYTTAHLAKARSLLAGAGYTLSGNTLTKNGKPITFTLVTTTNNALRQATQEIIQANLRQIGIAITIKQVDSNVLFSDYKTQGSMSAGDGDMFLFSWDTTPFLSSNASIYRCVPTGPGGKPDRSREQSNEGLGCDHATDVLIDKALVAPDPASANALWNQIDQRLWADMFSLPLFQRPSFIAYNKRYDGIHINATVDGPLWNSPTWTVKK